VRLTLLVPGLCGPPGPAATGDRLQALERLLSRSVRRHGAGNDLDTTLCMLFGLEDFAGGSPPVAVFTCLSDTGLAPAGYILRADPVHLRPDQACLRLFDSHAFTVTPAEADELAAACNALYAERGWRLEAAHPHRWYLTLPQAPELCTVNPVHVAGRDIDPALPRGADAAAWHAVMNEIQMLLHTHVVNTAREARGEPVINSLWFWGGGTMPATLGCRVDRICSDHPLARGLAQCAGIPVQGQPATAAELLQSVNGGRLLVVLNTLEWDVAYADTTAWAAGLRHLERHWFVPLLEAVDSGRVKALEVHPCNRQVCVTGRWRQRLFWRPIRSLASCCPRA
jgi:hypothetical protein